MAMSLSAAQPAIPTSTTSFHPRDRRWIIVHPSFPLGFRHFLDPHQQRERTIWINVPWCQLPIPLVFQQRALHAWDSSTQDSTGHVLWRASQKLSEYIIQYSCSISKPLTVLELGCGACALPSIIASLCGHKVIATDLKEILPPAKVNIDYNLKSLINLRINAAPWTIQCTCEDRNSSPRNECKTCNSVKFPNINVCELLWGQPHTLKDNVDLVLASDILYALPGQPEFFTELAITLEMLLVKPGARAIFAYQHRSGVERRFFDEVLANKFICREVNISNSVHVNSDNDRLIKIFDVERK